MMPCASPPAPIGRPRGRPSQISPAPPAAATSPAGPASPASAGGGGGSAQPPDGKAADELFASDEFRMYAFKILPCSKRTSHDWTTCPYVHPGEKARRRDPRMFSYLAVPCPDVKQVRSRRAARAKRVTAQAWPGRAARQPRARARWPLNGSPPPSTPRPCPRRTSHAPAATPASTATRCLSIGCTPAATALSSARCGAAIRPGPGPWESGASEACTLSLDPLVPPAVTSPLTHALPPAAPCHGPNRTAQTAAVRCASLRTPCLTCAPTPAT
jgi:hypothetical protein